MLDVVYYRDINNVSSFLSESWTVIELGISIDRKLITDYYNELETRLQHLCFNFNMRQYLIPEIADRYEKEGRVFNYVGEISAWTVSWPIDRTDIPIPGQYQANVDVYPELQNCDFYNDAHPISAYKFGYLNRLLEVLSERALRQILIAKHPPKLQVLPHVDSKSIKLHIPMKTNEYAFFYFGEDQQIKVAMELGKAYLINPSVMHSTANLGTTDRVHLLSRVDADYAPILLCMTTVI